MKMNTLRTFFLLLLVCLLSTGAQARESKNHLDVDLSGFWEGTFSVEDLVLKGADKHISVQLGSDGRFMMYGFNFHTRERALEVKGAWKLEGDRLTFIWEEKGDMVAVSFERTYVEREERSADVKWRLYLNNHERGLHLHLGWKGPVASDR